MIGGVLFERIAYRSSWSAVQHIVNDESMPRHEPFRTSVSFINESILSIILSLSGTNQADPRSYCVIPTPEAESLPSLAASGEH
jgi:hypothetical protein